MGFLKAIDEWIRDCGGPAPGRYEVAGKTVACGHCGGEVFVEGSQAPVAKVYLKNSTATSLVCAECGLVVSFIGKPDLMMREGKTNA